MAAPTGRTPNLDIPYPIPDDDVNVPRDIQAVADWLDSDGGLRGVTVLTQAPILDVGMAGQIRAGRQLTVADFTNMGLSQPIGLWNLSDLSNLGSDGRALINKGAVPFGVGINGLASTAAVFAGSSAQALYIADSGAGDPYRIRSGSWGCWYRSARRAVTQYPMSKFGVAQGQRSFYISSAGAAAFVGYGDGANDYVVTGNTDVHDDRWHFLVGTFDNQTIRVYVDGVLDGTKWQPGIINTLATGPVNIGSYNADAATASLAPTYGRIDEAFVTADVLTEDQIRALYCAKHSHGLVIVPRAVRLNVTRRRMGAALAVADFPSQPLRLHNFVAGSLADEGANGVVLVNPSGYAAIAGPDGTPLNGYHFGGAVTAGLNSTDAGLPSGLATHSYGFWVKTGSSATQGFMGWGASSAHRVGCLVASVGAQLFSDSGADRITGPVISDSYWHHVVIVEDNAAADGGKRKMYLDGRLVGVSTAMNSFALAGAQGFRVGVDAGANNFLNGQISRVFVCGYALTAAEVAKLYVKGTQALPLSPKEPGHHVEAVDATSLLTIFDTLDMAAMVDLGVTV